jgi:uncharacterized protein DUF998
VEGFDMAENAKRFQNLLLTCGILASLLSFGSDVLAGALWTEYNFVSRSAGELSAIGAPTRPFVLLFQLAYYVLMIAFGAGVWGSAEENRALRITAGLVIGNAVIALVASAFFPTRLGTVSTLADTGVMLMAVSVLCFLLAMGFGAAAIRGWFRFLSIGTLITFFLLAMFRLVIVPHVAAEDPTWVGLQERTMIYSYLLWATLLALVLLRVEKKPGLMDV